MPQDPMGLAQSRLTQAGNGVGANSTAQDSTLSQYEGDLTQSPMYKSMYNARVQDTTAAYNNARFQRNARARMAGFGTTTPMGQTDKSSVDAMEAGDIGRAGSDTMQTLMPYQMAAAGMRGQNISTYTKSGDDALSTYNSAYQADQQRKSAMWNKIAGVGMIGASMIPGVGPALKGGLQMAGSGMMH